MAKYFPTFPVIICLISLHFINKKGVMKHMKYAVVKLALAHVVLG